MHGTSREASLPVCDSFLRNWISCKRLDVQYVTVISEFHVQAASCLTLVGLDGAKTWDLWL